MRRALRCLTLAAVLCVSPSPFLAQVTTDDILTRLADSITVGDYCQAARQVLASPAVIRALDADSTNTRSNAAIICDPLLSSFSLLALTGRARAPMAAVARLRTEGYSAARQGIFEAMSELRATVRADPVRAVVRDSTAREVSTALTRASETAQNLLTAAARDRALVRLANYERKLGPTSAKLNGLEVLLNYGAQRWVPGFKATPLGGPSPWEVVASYTPGYVTWANDRVQPVSVSEFGLRRYLFGEKFGKSGIPGLLMPSYWAVGFLTASDRNGALVAPWEGNARSGGYVGWGTVKVGYIADREGQWMIGKQFQAVRFLF